MTRPSASSFPTLPHHPADAELFRLQHHLRKHSQGFLKKVQVALDADLAQQRLKIRAAIGHRLRFLLEDVMEITSARNHCALAALSTATEFKPLLETLTRAQP